MSLSRCCGFSLVLTLAASPSALGQARPEPMDFPVLTLESALEIALAHNRKLASAELEVGKAEDRLGSLKAQRWPVLSIEALGSRILNTVEFQVDEGTFGSYTGIGPIPGADTKITTPPSWTAIGLGVVKQPLSDLYKIGLGVDAREILVQSAKEDLRGGRQSVALQVRKTYYAIVGAESSLAAARESLALSKEVERVVADRVAVEAALKYDLVDARAASARAEYQIVSLESALATSREQLNILLGRDAATPFRVSPLSDPRPVAEQAVEAAEQASLRRPDVERARLQASTADLDARIAKAEYLPEISFVASYFSPWALQFQPNAVWSVGLLLKWDVFDGGKRGKDLAEKRKAAEQARLAVADAEAAARLESGRDWRKLRDAERLLAASDLARQAMQDRLRVARSRFEEHASLAQELLKVQADLAEANHSYNDSLASYWSTRADYEESIGEDL